MHERVALKTAFAGYFGPSLQSKVMAFIAGNSLPVRTILALLWSPLERILRSQESAPDLPQLQKLQDSLSTDIAQHASLSIEAQYRKSWESERICSRRSAQWVAAERPVTAKLLLQTEYLQWKASWSLALIKSVGPSVGNSEHHKIFVAASCLMQGLTVSAQEQAAGWARDQELCQGWIAKFEHAAKYCGRRMQKTILDKMNLLHRSATQNRDAVSEAEAQRPEELEAITALNLPHSGQTFAWWYSKQLVCQRSLVSLKHALGHLTFLLHHHEQQSLQQVEKEVHLWKTLLDYEQRQAASSAPWKTIQDARIRFANELKTLSNLQKSAPSNSVEQAQLGINLKKCLDLLDRIEEATPFLTTLERLKTAHSTAQESTNSIIPSHPSLLHLYYRNHALQAVCSAMQQGQKGKAVVSTRLPVN